MDEIYYADDVCERWRISRKTLFRWITDGIPGVDYDVPYLRIGRKVAFTGTQVREIEAAMAARAVAV